MKVYPHLEKRFAELQTKNSSDIEYDSILSFTKKLTSFLENKIKDETNPKKIQAIINKNFMMAVDKCDKGITMDGYSKALNIIDKYWMLNIYIKRFKTL